jgi:PAS domain S-box-containing protein
MPSRTKWITLFFIVTINPVLLSFLYPVLGSSANMLSMAAPIVATLFFGFKVGAIVVPVNFIISGIVFSQISAIPRIEGMTRALLPIGVTLIICFGADRLRLYLNQRKKAELRLRESERRYRMIFEHSADGIILLDQQGIVLDASPRVKAHLGYPPEALIGRSYRDTGIFPSDAQKKIDGLLEDETPPHTTEMEIVCRDKGGDEIYVELNLSLIGEQSGQAKWICMLKNTTERRDMVVKLQQAQKMEAIGRLAGGVAHDINNTLNAIIGSAFALRHELSTFGRRFEDLENITSACDRGSQLTRNLLGFARKSSFTKQHFSLNNVVESVLALLMRTSSKDIRAETRLAENLPLIEGDQNQIENAVMNICINAHDAMQQRGRLTISTTADVEGVSIEVTDTGTGMDEETRRQVFEPFFTTKPVGKGTGLGLSMVYGVVQNHGGSINIDSTVGKGTTVTLTFPASALAEQKKVRASTIPPPEDAPKMLSCGTVLLVDDEPLVLRAGARMLQTLGCSVLSAQSGKEALEIYKEKGDTISLVILDLIMPEMDGTTTLEKLRELDDKLPVLLASGYSHDIERVGDLQARPACGFLPKPYRPDALVAAARKILKNQAA